MHRNAIYLQLVLLATVLAIASSANILDFLYWNMDKGSDIEKRDKMVKSSSADDADTDDNTASDGSRSCSCSGPNCICCVDFNITYIDLGGPGCVIMKYISQGEGLLVNVSYGDSLLYSEQVKAAEKPKPTCVPLLANFAKVCATFSSLEITDDGLTGCLQLEPKLLGDTQTEFHIGCFTMDPDGMRLNENTTINRINEATNSTNQDEPAGLNEDELLAVVNESAQQGLAFFENLLGINFGNDETTNQTDATTTETPEAPETVETRHLKITPKVRSITNLV